MIGGGDPSRPVWTILYRDMHRSSRSSIALARALLASTVLVASPALAAPPDAGDAVLRAERAVADDRTAHGRRPVALTHTTTLSLPTTTDDVVTVRFGQRHHGLEVDGAAVAVRLHGSQGEASSATIVGRLFDALDVDPVPAFDEAYATRLARAELDGPSRKGRVALVVLPDGETGRLVWRIDLVDRAGAARVRVDAHVGTLVGGVERRVRHAQGRVYAQNQVTTPTPVDVELHDLDVGVPQRLDGWNGHLHVVQHGGGDLFDPMVLQTLGPSAGADFLWPPPADFTDATDAFAQVNVFHHLTEMRRTYAALGVDMSDPSWSLKAVVNATMEGSPLDNAFYMPSDGDPGPFAADNWIVVGQGSITDFAYDADVIKHELGHYVGERAIGYNLGFANATAHGLSPFSAAIDEGMSDYFSASDNGDPLAGEGAPGSLGLTRDLGDTGLRCPDDLQGEPHADGLLAGSLSWSLRTILGRETADTLMFGALSMSMPGLSFGDLGRAVLVTADDLVAAGSLGPAARDAVEAELEARGLLACDPEIPLEAGGERTLSVVGLDKVEQWFGVGPCDYLQSENVEFPPLFQIYRDASSNDTRLRFVVEVEGERPGEGPHVRALLRKGEAPGFVMEDGLVPLPTANAFDREVDVYPGVPETIDVDAGSMPALEVGARYYLSFTNPSCSTARVTVRTEPITEPPTAASTGSGATGASGSGAGTGGVGGAGGAGADDPVIVGGCGCTVPARSVDWRGAVWLGVVVGVAVLRGRRRS